MQCGKTGKNHNASQEGLLNYSLPCSNLAPAEADGIEWDDSQPQGSPATYPSASHSKTLIVRLLMCKVGTVILHPSRDYLLTFLCTYTHTHAAHTCADTHVHTRARETEHQKAWWRSWQRGDPDRC